MDKIPTESDWRSVPWCLDIPYAYEHFNGKSLDEAVQLLVENALYYQEDLMFMPTPCMHFYIHAYINYLMSDASIEDCDAASCFFGLIKIRAEDMIAAGDTMLSRLSVLLDRLETHQNWYHAPPDIYGDFAIHVARSRSLLKIGGYP